MPKRNQVNKPESELSQNSSLNPNQSQSQPEKIDTGIELPEPEVIEAEAPKKRGRKKKETESDAVAETLIKNYGSVFSAFWKNVFHIIAKRGGDHWELAPSEATSLADASTALMAKYVSEMMFKYSEEIGFAFIFSSIALPRYIQTIEMNEKFKAENSKQVGNA